MQQFLTEDGWRTRLRALLSHYYDNDAERLATALFGFAERDSTPSSTDAIGSADVVEPAAAEFDADAGDQNER